MRDSRASLGLWLSDGREVTLALLAFGPVGGAAEPSDLTGGATVNAALPTDETWWSVLVAACGPTLIAAARSPGGAAGALSPSPQAVHGDADQIAAWHREAGRPAPSPKTQSEAFRHAQRWLRGVRLNDKTRGWRVAVVDQVIGLRLVTLDDVRRLFPAQVPPDLPSSDVRSPPRPAGVDDSPHRGRDRNVRADVATRRAGGARPRPVRTSDVEFAVGTPRADQAV